MTITGSGTSGDPYVIYTLADLALIGTSPYTLDKYYKLNNDIDASPTSDPGYNGGAGWIPIGTSAARFNGNFNGNNKTISGLFINRPTTDNVGLFGYTQAGVRIYDLNLDVNITGQNNVGGLLGYYYYQSSLDIDIIWNINVEGAVTGNNQVGGIVGVKSTYGYLNNCDCIAEVTGANQVGGIFGQALNFDYRGIIKYCDFNGILNITGNRGGLIGGESTQDVAYCNSYTGIMNASATSDYIGGIIGYCISRYVSNCKCFADISGRDYVGGILGVKAQYHDTSYCKHYGIVSGANRVGGIAGHHGTRGYTAVLFSCYHRGEIVASGNYVGGIAGSNSTIIEKCIVTTDTIINNPNSSQVGGIVGLGSHGTIRSCVNLTDVTGLNFVGGICGRKDTYDSYAGNQNHGNIVGQDYVGGICGYFANYNYSAAYYKQFNAGSVTGRDYVGGIAGRCDCNNYDNYNIGVISGRNSVGGIFGYQYYWNLARAYSTGMIIGTGTGIGGLVGTRASGGNTYSFWDVEASGIAVSANGTGKTTAQMKDQATYTSWDFTTTPVWIISEGFNNGYPYLNETKYVNIAKPTGILSQLDIGTLLIRIKNIILHLDGIESSLEFGIPKLSAVINVPGIDQTIQIGTLKTIMEIVLQNKGIKLTEIGTLKTIMEVVVENGGIPPSDMVGMPNLLFQISPEGIDNEIVMGAVTLIWDQFIRPNGLESFISFGELVTYIRYWKENIEFVLKQARTNFTQEGGTAGFIIFKPNTRFELKTPNTRFELLQPKKGSKAQSQTLFELRK